MTNLWLARLLNQFAVELEVSPCIALTSVSHGIAQTILREGMTDAITSALSASLKTALLDELRALPANMPLEGVYQIAASMFIECDRIEPLDSKSRTLDLKCNLVRVRSGVS